MEAGSEAAVGFDPEVDVSPFALFRRLVEGRPPLLVDLREPGSEAAGLTLAGAVRSDEPIARWRPPADVDVVLFDADGTGARAAARGLHEEGFPRVRALFGGLALYDFALDPAVVGSERFLVEFDG